MDIKSKYNFLAFQLLILYLASIFLPIFHQHEVEIPSYSKSNACEKTIFYNSKSDVCNHATHISAVIKKCSICDQNFTAFTPEINNQLFDLFPVFNENISTNQSQLSYCLVRFFSNKGPPIV
jgi:hypothetical protein